VLAGMVVGALGVLTDIAVSQASAVTALHRADPSLAPRALYRAAFAIGRDHLAATIHTLVLAYVGAALPLILVLRDAHVGVTDAINGQIVAEPVIATLVGATALIAAVPITTALAARRPACRPRPRRCDRRRSRASAVVGQARNEDTSGGASNGLLVERVLRCADRTLQCPERQPRHERHRHRSTAPRSSRPCTHAEPGRRPAARSTCQSGRAQSRACSSRTEQWRRAVRRRSE
jgi:YibE/F-like protein